ncbi:MAG TPA: hypothetical protein VNG90_04015, partial [Candidatus Acidoferrum sp.]|nr:hypothetical protein [Candidatus Acidoferrum sp.]
MSITGTVDGSVRLIGQTLNLDGAIGRSASVVAQTLTINQNVMGDLSFAGNDLVANKNIGRDLGFAATSVTLNGRVGRDITGTDKHLTFGPHAIVGGTVNYHSDENASLGQGAQVTALHRTALPKTDRQSQPIWSFWGMVASWLLFVAMSLFAALVFVLVCPRALRAASDRTHNRFGWALLAGIVGSIVAPILAIVLCFTIIGLPLAFVVVVSWMLLSAFSLPVAGLWLGRLMLPKTNNAIPVILLGVLVIELLMMIPFLNVLVGVASYWIGLGSILLAIRDHAQKPDYHLRSTRG